MNTIEIRSSKTKLILLILFSLSFIFFGLLLIINPDKFVSAIFRNVIFIQIAGLAALLFSAFCLILLIKSFLTKKFNLIINEKGIIDNSSYLSVGMITWDDVTSIKTINVMSTKFLLIHVKNPNNYVNSQSGIKRSILKRNIKSYGTPISISSNTLNYNFQKLENTILQYYSKYKIDNI